MNIITATRDYSRKDIFRMVRNSDALKDVGEGEVLSVAGYCYADNENANGETQTLLYMETREVDGKTRWIATTSSTAYREMIDIWDAFYDGSNPVDVEHVTGVSKSGRTYHTLKVI